MRIDHGLLPGHVLQRTAHGARAAITGTCTANGAVLATVRRGRRIVPGFRARRVGMASAGSFKAVLTGLPTGGPYAVELACGGQRVVVDEVFVGDLWLLAGQSNMEGAGLLSDAVEPHPLVRCFAMARRWELARDPLHFLAESPDPVHGGGVITRAQARQAKRWAVKGTGVGLSFGRLMQERSGVPQGLIATAHGGTAMEQWDPLLKDRGGDSLYGSMWLSLQAVGQPLAGVLWYQGCSDTDPRGAAAYTARMQTLVAALRRDLGQPTLPWLLVQIGRVVDAARRNPQPWNDVQELQRRLPETIAHCDIVPAVDLELDDPIHLSGRAFVILAARLARLAARLVLGDRREKPAPQPRALRLLPAKPGLGPRLEVRFANLVGGLAADGLPQGFALVDAQRRPFDGHFKTELRGDCAILHLHAAPQEACWLQYGQGVNPICNLRDGRGMAIPVFGPWQFASTLPLSEWCQRWLVGPIRPGEELARLPCPDDQAEAVEHRFRDGFVNLHADWAGKTGHLAYYSHIDVSEDMEVEIRLGYDGPFCMWLGSDQIHRDLYGTNPALKDAHRITRRLSSGRHAVRVLMALNSGRAWGFFMRFARTGTDLGGTPALPVPWQ